MPDARQLSMLADIAQDRREKAARNLGRTLSLLKESEARLTLLESYCGDYRSRLAQNTATGVSADELRNFRDFIGKLEEAIGQQRAEVEAIRQAVVVCRDGWLVERRREHSYEVLTERAQLGIRAEESRRLQKLTDEFAGRVANLRAAR